MYNEHDEQEQTEEQEEIAEEYQDTEHLATVTVVEDFDPHALIHGPPKQPGHIVPGPKTMSKPAPKPKTNNKAEKLKRKGKTRYQTKDASRLERTKQRARRTKKEAHARDQDTRKKGKKSGRGR